MRTVTTQTISIKADFEKAFSYISNPLNQKKWAINFIKDVKEVGNGFIAITPFGEAPIQIKSDINNGLIDILIGENPSPTHTRLIKNEEGCEYIFTLLKPNEMPEQLWLNQGVPGLIEELQTLKSILENESLGK